MVNKPNELSIRFAAAIARMDGDEGLLRKLAAITSADLPQVIEETGLALREGKSEQVALGLHKLQGMLGIFETGSSQARRLRHERTLPTTWMFTRS